ncbi:MAG: caspase family protein [Propylenella sp.]
MKGVLPRLTAALLALGVITACPALAAGERVALVIGNSAYQNVSRLPNPANDAAALASALQRLDFAVTQLSDLTGAEMRRALQDFEPAAAGAEIAVVYYAGHGIELNGTNYLIPVDAALKRDTHVEDEAVSLVRVQRAVEGASRLRLILLDACRDNPFIAEMERNEAQRSIGRGLARVEPPPQTLIAYAAKGGTTAADGDEGHSPYAASLLNHIETPGLELNFLFRIVHDEVLEETGGRQEPFVYGSLGATEIYLKPAGAEPTVAPAPTPTAPAEGDQLAEVDYLAALSDNTEESYRAYLRKHPGSPRTAQVNTLLSALVENKLWETVEDEDTIAAYQRYIAAFPEGVYADDARTRMQRLIDERRALTAREPEQPPSSAVDQCGHPHGDYRVVGIASNDVLWVRTAPNRDAAATGSMPPGAQGIGIGRCVNVAGYSQPWCEVRYRCVAGWSYSRYLSAAAGGSPSAPETFRVVGVASNDVLNMRSGPGTGYGIVAEIPPNGAGIAVSACQPVTGFSSKWCTVTWQGVSGWASACCLAGERTGRRPD